ncbi:hypothetical protein HRR83_003138 [Exophiala dermatitidis]|uniref:Uncharacterized protein n=1 Tax=Exophiala dermatitidis TaxID=5970 RepID=A0AAN6IQD5_EXODE|nr:hypothetical protein HRR75_007545 [Exophiala dermatitidis]KAJ4506320.1 hypothetical protein HRR73_008118 [Exophiala dermatitidis]KAJ4506901.1 hypothetical protein HRR74_008217 [Exophiala dermatitidis]KAJ4547902.1 hypothetical protein HRR76_000523 [Exophiala dermatitidis]KAJ4553843.1 hypothetical protein HRR77_002213 [Exophiala dermatitidis]
MCYREYCLEYCELCEDRHKVIVSYRACIHFKETGVCLRPVFRRVPTPQPTLEDMADLLCGQCVAESERQLRELEREVERARELAEQEQEHDQDQEGDQESNSESVSEDVGKDEEGEKKEAEEEGRNESA